jgi:hypothetical protein
MGADAEAVREFSIDLSEHEIQAILGALDRDQVAYAGGQIARAAGVTRDHVAHQWRAQLDQPRKV